MYYYCINFFGVKADISSDKFSAFFGDVSSHLTVDTDNISMAPLRNTFGKVTNVVANIGSVFSKLNDYEHIYFVCL